MGELPDDIRTDLITGNLDPSVRQQLQTVGSVISIPKKNKRKNILGGPMNMEEIKMNKELLKEISAMKKKGGERNASRMANSPSMDEKSIDIQQQH